MKLKIENRHRINDKMLKLRKFSVKICFSNRTSPQINEERLHRKGMEQYFI